jgi:hypothetical protein
MTTTESTPPTPGSAMPQWLQEVLPQWFKDRPALTEAAYAFSVSSSHVAITVGAMIYGNAVSAGVQADDVAGVVVYGAHHWLSPLMGLIVGGTIATTRGLQARSKAVAAAKEASP